VNRRCALLVLAACGNPGTSGIPRERPAVRLVRCAPATPAPAPTDAPVERTPEVVRAGTFTSGTRNLAQLEAKPAVSFGTATTTGPISGPEVVSIATTRRAEVLACFGSEIRTNVRIAVVYRFTIGADGTVSNIDATGNALGGALDACIRRSLRALRYAAKGASTTVNLPIVWDRTGTFGVAAAPSTIEPDPWTPFALDSRTPTATAASAARATEAAVRGKLAAIDKCFGNPGPRGSLRLLLELDLSGARDSVRAGGLGDKDTEWCAAKALADLHVLTPAQEHVEISCDLSRGDAAAWRVSPTAGYELIDADTKSLRHDTETVVPGVSEPEPLPSATYLIVARPDTLGGMIQLALMWARDATAVLLAVGDGKAPPVFLGMGNASPSEEDDEAVRPALRIGRRVVTGCVGRANVEVALASSSEVAGLMRKLHARCRSLRCAPTMVVSIDSDAVTRDVLEVAGAARRAGFDRVLFGGAELGCSNEPRRKAPDLELDPESE